MRYFQDRLFDNFGSCYIVDFLSVHSYRLRSTNQGHQLEKIELQVTVAVWTLYASNKSKRKSLIVGRENFYFSSAHFTVCVTFND